MTGAQFAKFCRDCRIIDRRVTPTEVDICYTRVRERWWEGGTALAPQALRRVAWILYARVPVAVLHLLRLPARYSMHCSTGQG